MTAEISLNHLRPIATPDEYENAHLMFDLSLGQCGAWNDVMRRALTETSAPWANAPLGNIAKLGFMVRLDEAVDYGGVAEMNHQEQPIEVARAFSRGFLQQIIPLQLIYSLNFDNAEAANVAGIHYNNMLNSVKTNKKVELSKETTQDLNAEYMSQLRSFGRSKITDASDEMIKKWADETYPYDADLSLAFTIGHLGVIFFAEQYQEFVNERLLRGVGASSLDSSAIDAFSSNSGGEQQHLL